MARFYGKATLSSLKILRILCMNIYNFFVSPYSIDIQDAKPSVKQSSGPCVPIGIKLIVTLDPRPPIIDCCKSSFVRTSYVEIIISPISRRSRIFPGTRSSHFVMDEVMRYVAFDDVAKSKPSSKVMLSFEASTVMEFFLNSAKIFSPTFHEESVCFP